MWLTSRQVPIRYVPDLDTYPVYGSMHGIISTLVVICHMTRRPMSMSSLRR